MRKGNRTQRITEAITTSSKTNYEVFILPKKEKSVKVAGNVKVVERFPINRGEQFAVLSIRSHMSNNEYQFVLGKVSPLWYVIKITFNLGLSLLVFEFQEVLKL